MEPRIPDSSETQQLLQQVRAGERKAADRLFTHHRAYLRRLIEIRMDPKLRPRLDPSDVVQEAQMEANRRLEDYLKQPGLPFRLWLRQIAYDRLLMLRRRHVTAGRRAVERDVALPNHSSMQLARQLFARGSTPSQRLVQREFAERVRLALDSLPEVEREIVILRNLEGLSNQEAAQVLETDPATASRRYGRAIIRLREILLQLGLGESEP